MAQRPSQYLSQYPPQLDSFKASSDDLIDEHSSPFATNAQHSVYAVQTPMPGHPRRPSYPLNDYNSRISDETANTSYQTYPPLPSAKEVDSTGFLQTILPESLACRLYVITVLIQTTIDLVIEGDLLIRFHEAGPNGDKLSIKMPVYLTIFTIAHVFQFLMAVDAVYARNTLQFLCLTIFNALLLVYAIIQIGEIRESVLQIPALQSDGISHIPIDVLTTILPVVIAIAEIAYMALGWKIYHEFGWKIYKFLGADRQIKRLYARYQIFQCLIKFDVFFWVGFSVQFIALVLFQKRDWEFYITCAALPVSLILLVEGHLAARHENKAMMITFMSGCVGALFYFLYKLFKVIKFKNRADFASIWKSLTTFSVISITLLIITFVFSVIVMRNFGRGLKESIDKNQNPVSNRLSQYVGPDSHRRGGSKTLNRMSID